MSKFKTSVAVDVNKVLALLPEGAFVHELGWNPDTKSVELVWEHEKVLTGRDFPVEFPAAAMLGQQAVPAGITIMPGLRGKAPAPETVIQGPGPEAGGTEGTQATPGTEAQDAPPPEAEAAPAAVAVTQSPLVPTTEEKPVAKSKRGK